MRVYILVAQRCDAHADEGNGVLVWDRGGMLASYDWEGTKNNDYTGHDRAILAIAVTDDRAHIASIGRDKRVLLFDATSGKPVWETDSMEVQCEKEQLGVIFAGESVVTWDSSGRIYLREVAGKGEPNAEFPTSRHSGWCRVVLNSPLGLAPY